MKSILLFMLGLAIRTSGADIDLKERVATFTNLQGRIYENVTLRRANKDGVIYSTDNGGGMVLYTNLNPNQLAAWNLSTNLAQEYLDRLEWKRQAKIQAELDRQHEAELDRQEKARAQRAADEYRRTNQVIEYYSPPRVTPRNRIGLGV